VADLTYLRLEREFAYLAVILDAWSRKVVGYAVGHVLDARLPLAALEAALESRRRPPGLLHHSDRGVQYASRRYRERLAEAGLRGSMSRTGNPYDNAQVESFIKTLKHEEVYLHDYATVQDAIDRLPHFLEEVYNRKTPPLIPGLSAPGGVRGPACADRRVGQCRRTRLSTFRGSLHSRKCAIQIGVDIP
jgi:putative transposase